MIREGSEKKSLSNGKLVSLVRGDGRLVQFLANWGTMLDRSSGNRMSLYEGNQYQVDCLRDEETYRGGNTYLLGYKLARR